MALKQEIFSSRKESNGYNPDACWGEFDTHEKKEKLGIKDHTVQGFGDLLDVNKLMERITPDQLRDLKLKHEKAQYGVQSNDTMRDVMMKAQLLVKDFKDLPAMVREHFKNDEFLYLDILHKEKDNKYFLGELMAEITGSESYKQQVEALKRKDEEDAKAILLQQQSLAGIIKDALSPEPEKK